MQAFALNRLKTGGSFIYMQWPTIHITRPVLWLVRFMLLYTALLALNRVPSSSSEFLRESIVARDIVGRYGHLSFLTKSELSSVIDYLANS